MKIMFLFIYNISDMLLFQVKSPKLRIFVFVCTQASLWQLHWKQNSLTSQWEHPVLSRARRKAWWECSTTTQLTTSCRQGKIPSHYRTGHRRRRYSKSLVNDVRHAACFCMSLVKHARILYVRVYVCGAFGCVDIYVTLQRKHTLLVRKVL